MWMLTLLELGTKNMQNFNTQFPQTLALLLPTMSVPSCGAAKFNLKSPSALALSTSHQNGPSRTHPNALFHAGNIETWTHSSQFRQPCC